MPAHEPIVTLDVVPGSERVPAAADGVIVHLEWAWRMEGLARVRRLGRFFPDLPILLITHEDADNARYLRDVAVDEVIWTREIEREVRGALARAQSRRFSGRVAESLASAHRLPAKLREALVHACKTGGARGSVAELAEEVGCDRSTLWLQWHHMVDGEPRLRLEDFLDWLLLLAATRRRVPGRSWVHVADELGVHEHTLSRVARRLTGSTLRDLTDGGPSRLAERFAREVLPRVVVESGARSAQGRSAVIQACNCIPRP